jgi:hypothetical protein
MSFPDRIYHFQCVALINLLIPNPSHLSGGYNHRDQITYSDTYILSLPGFVWTRAADIPAGGRRLPACVAVGSRQVLSIGGTIGLDWKDKDPAPQGLQVFDMTEMKWKESYDADAAPYERPAAIKAWYSNGLV